MDECSKFYTLFSNETKQKLSARARAIIQSHKQNPAHQLLTISVVERRDDIQAHVFAELIQNFELSIRLKESVNEKSASEYLNPLREKIANNNVKHILFE